MRMAAVPALSVLCELRQQALHRRVAGLPHLEGILDSLPPVTAVSLLTSCFFSNHAAGNSALTSPGEAGGAILAVEQPANPPTSAALVAAIEDRRLKPSGR
jgi:hypothetical protein